MQSTRRGPGGWPLGLKVLGLAVLIGLGVGALWLFSPLFFDRRVDEAFPAARPTLEAAAPAPTALPTVAPTSAPEQAPPGAPAAQAGESGEQAALASPATAGGEPALVPMEAATEAPTSAPTAPPTELPTSAPTAPPTEAPTSAPTAVPTPSGPVALRSGSFISGPVRGDEAYGTATIYQLEDASRLLRLEEFSSTNGPDLFVILSTSANPVAEGLGEWYTIEALKGNQGNQNYALPAELDLGAYQSVVIWCRAFDVVFGYATLS